MTFLAIFTTVALLLLAVVAAHNLIYFPRLRLASRDRRLGSFDISGFTSGRPDRFSKPVRSGGDNCQKNLETGAWQSPGVSILIPARNEAAKIGQTVTALLAQAYPTFELLVLDDDSTDGTAEVARQAARGDPRCCVRRGAPLPLGWVGKNWACHQLAQAANYDLLLFTDADVCWQPDALAAVMAQFQGSKADLLTVWPTQTTVTWSERLVVPLMALAVLAYLPVWLAHRSPYPAAAAANGQAMLFRRAAYQRCGGHAGVRGEVIEDVRLAQRIKAMGLRLYMVDGNQLVRTRMYRCWQEVRDGYAKNILAGHWNSPALLVFSTLFHLLIFVGPWLWLAAGAWGDSQAGWPLWPLTLIGLGLGVRGLTAWMTGQRLVDALWLPLSVLLMSRIAGQALWWRLRYGGPVWKGRRLGDWEGFEEIGGDSSE